MDQPIAFAPAPVIPEPPKKSRLFIILSVVLLVVLLAVVGYLYFQYYQLKQQLTQPQLLPSPSPETEAFGPTADWQTYTDPKGLYLFKYPSDWFSGVSGDGTILINNNSFNANQVVEPEQAIITLEIIADKNLIQVYIKNKNIDSQEETGNRIIFDLIDLTSKPLEGSPLKQVFFAQTLAKNKLFRFGLSNIDFKSTFDLILSTFKFLGAEAGICQPTFPVETNTQEMTAGQNYALECTLKKTEGDCLSVDIYNQSAKDFSQPDGKPDCRWVISP